MPAYPTQTQKIMKYAEAPSGRINIYKWEPPFAPVRDGHGFIGMVAEDVKTGKLQCHECGIWAQMLCPHYAQKHGMTGEQYRAKFGLLQNTALKSSRIRLLQSALLVKLQKEGSMNVGNKRNKNGKKYGFLKGNKESANRKGIKKAAEAANRHGVCDLQIMTKIINLGKKLGKTPSLVDIKDEYGGGIISIIHSRYSSYIKYCRETLKLEPLRSKDNPWTKKQWRTFLLDMGLKGLKKGKKLTVKGLLPTNEQRYIYKYFKSFKDYKHQLLKI